MYANCININIGTIAKYDISFNFLYIKEDTFRCIRTCIWISSSIAFECFIIIWGNFEYLI